MVALPAHTHITLACPVCDEPVKLPLRTGAVLDRTVQLSLDNRPLNEHVAVEHFGLLLTATRTPRAPACPG